MGKWIYLALMCLVTFRRADAQTDYGRNRTDGISNKQTITITGATPSVAVGNVFLTGNTSATTITNFTGGTHSQNITVICGDANTTIANNSNIVIGAGGNIPCAVNATYQFAYNAGLGKWLQTASGAGGANQTNVGLKPNMPGGGGGIGAVGGIMYVSVTGNDANDGLSWGTSKTTIDAAICALPTGNCASRPPQAGQGTVYYQEGVYANANPNYGIWIAGSGVGPPDSQYKNLPAGWMKAAPGGALNVVCATHSVPGSNDHKGKCMVQGGSRSVNKPLLWLSGTGTMYFEGLESYYVPVAWVGVDSTGNVFGDPRTNWNSGQAISVTLDNIACYMPQPTTPGMGPCMIQGANYWNHVWDSDFGGMNAEMLHVTNFSRTSGVTTVTTTTHQCPFEANDTVTIFNITSGDTSFGGTHIVVTGCGRGNTFTYSQSTFPNSTNSSPGAQTTAASDRAWAVLLYGTQIEMSRLHASGGGGIKFAATNSSNLELHNVYMEGTTYGAPMLYISNPGGGIARVSGLYMADTGLTSGIINEGAQLFDDTIQNQSTSILGSGVHLNEGGSRGRRSSYLANNAIGNYGNYLQAVMDTARRTGGPTSVRFGNQANLAPGFSCGSNSANLVVTSGKADPFGGTGAYQLTSTSGTSAACFYQTSQSYSVGDTFVAGVWMRTGNNSSIPFNATQLTLQGLAGGAGDICTTTQGTNNGQGAFAGDGNWEWVLVSCTVYANRTQPSVLAFYMHVASTQTIQVFAPYFGKVPVGALSNNELAEFLDNIPGGFSQGAVPGDVSFYSGQRLCLPSGTTSNTTCGYEVHNNTANRTYTFPDASGPVGLVIPTRLTTTAATSDNVTVTGMTSSGHCDLTATNSSAATNSTTTYVSAKTANQITVTHTATSGMTYDILCTPN
jgi:hypothetical protein